MKFGLFTIGKRAGIALIGVGTSVAAMAQSSQVGADGDSSMAESLDGWFEPDLMSSARVGALSGAMTTSADDLTAASFNPAGIGGQYPDKAKVPWLKRLYFPWVGVSANRNSMGLYREFQRKEGGRSSAVGRAIIDAHAGSQQYTRVSGTMALVLGRVMVMPIQDHQVAAVSQGDGSGLVQAAYRGTSGIGGGGSVQSADGRLSLGYFGYRVERTEIKGRFDYSAFTGRDDWRAQTEPYSRKLSGTGHNVGGIWRWGKKWNPSMGLALRDVGHTKFRAQGVGDDEVQRQNLALAVSLAPRLGRNWILMPTLGADRLTEGSRSLDSKAHFGTELTYDGLGSYALLALRVGATRAGGSFGVGAHLGLLGFDLSYRSVDVGVGGRLVVEQRSMLNVYVNVAEF